MPHILKGGSIGEAARTVAAAFGLKIAGGIFLPW
jgi:hypothetical protein